MTEAAIRAPRWAWTDRVIGAGLARLLVRLPVRVILVAERIVARAFADGFIHAGNLAYLSLLTLFPFFIVLTSVGRLIGETEEGPIVLAQFMMMLPRNVAAFLEQPIADVLNERSGQSLLTIGLVIGLWTVASYIETMRDIMHRAYESNAERAFWHYRLTSIVMTLLTVIVMLAAFSAQVLITGIEEFVQRTFAIKETALAWLALSRCVPMILLFGALLMLFRSLAPQPYRRGCPHWPGALLTSFVWIGTTLLLPVVLGQLADYSLTYGSMAGVMIALLFFYVVGLGFVLGAELNAALAVVPKNVQKNIIP